jgi:hypothetical protein
MEGDPGVGSIHSKTRVGTEGTIGRVLDRWKGMWAKLATFQDDGWVGGRLEVIWLELATARVQEGKANRNCVSPERLYGNTVQTQSIRSPLRPQRFNVRGLLRVRVRQGRSGGGQGRHRREAARTFVPSATQPSPRTCTIPRGGRRSISTNSRLGGWA